MEALFDRPTARGLGRAASRACFPQLKVPSTLARWAVLARDCARVYSRVSRLVRYDKLLKISEPTEIIFCTVWKKTLKHFSSKLTFCNFDLWYATPRRRIELARQYFLQNTPQSLLNAMSWKSWNLILRICVWFLRSHHIYLTTKLFIWSQ